MSHSNDLMVRFDLDSFLAHTGELYPGGIIEAYFEESVREILATMRECLGTNIAFLSEFIGENRVFQVVDSSDIDPIIRAGESAPLEESYCLRVADGRFPCLIDDAMAFEAAREIPATEAVPVRAHASIPVYLSDGSIYGTLCCFSTETEASFDHRDLAMLKLSGKLVARQVDKAAIQHRKANDLAASIQSIIDNDLMHPVYQPIYRMSEDRIVGYEALIRFDVEPYRAPDL